MVLVVILHKQFCTMGFGSWETKFGVVVLHGNVQNKVRTGLRNEKKEERPTLSFCTFVMKNNHANFCFPTLFSFSFFVLEASSEFFLTLP